MNKLALCLLFLFWQQPAVENIVPAFEGFYSKKLDAGGIPIRSSGLLADQALIAAAKKIDLMLAHIPEVRRNLKGWGAELHVIGKNQKTSDLPEFYSMKGVTYKDNVGTMTNIDDRTRGMGNSIYASCGEENLLNLPHDRYAGGQDICTHEFAHTIMDFGLDESIEQAITDQYHRAMKKGLWRGAYAAVNQGEYWAELSMWYFGAHGEYLPDTKMPQAGTAALRQYDPEGYALLKAIYSGKRATRALPVSQPLKVSAATTTVKSGAPAWLMVTNTTAQQLELCLIAQNGAATEKKVILPYSSAICPVHFFQVWQVKPLSRYQVNAPYCRLVF